MNMPRIAIIFVLIIFNTFVWGKELLNLEVFDSISIKNGTSATSFVIGKFGYFMLANNQQTQTNLQSWIYKYNNMTQQFIPIYQFENSYQTKFLYPFQIHNQVLPYFFSL